MRKYTLSDIQGQCMHGQEYYNLYDSYYAIMRRCYNKSYKQFKDYGQRGISISDEWKGNPYAFILWILNNLGPRPEGQTLDRIETNGHYEPGNLQWSTKSEQQFNRRNPLPKWITENA